MLCRFPHVRLLVPISHPFLFMFLVSLSVSSTADIIIEDLHIFDR